MNVNRRNFIKFGLIGIGSLLIPTTSLAAPEPIQIPESYKLSSFDRINVSRIITYIRDNVTEILKYYDYELNDKITRDAICEHVYTFMASIENRRGIEDFEVICDEQNNPPKVVDSNQLILNIVFRMKKNSEKIYLRFEKSCFGDSFKEYAI